VSAFPDKWATGALSKQADAIIAEHDSVQKAIVDQMKRLKK
jgi:hypothetical protein